MCHWDADSNGNVDANCYSVSHAYSYIDGYDTAESYTNSDSYCYIHKHAESYRNSYVHTDTNTQRDTNSHSYGYIHDHAESYGNAHSDTYGETDAHRSARRNTEATSNASAETDVRAPRRFWERRLLAPRLRDLGSLPRRGTTSPLSLCREECCRQGCRQLKAGSLCSPEPQRHVATSFASRRCKDSTMQYLWIHAIGPITRVVAY